MALITLAQAKEHLRIDGVAQDVDVALKVDQASAIILRHLRGRRIPVSSTSTGVLAVTSSGGVATVTTATPHGLATNDTVTIWGAAEAAYNGAFTVTVVDTVTFTYAISGTPASPATGGVGLRTAEGWTTFTVPYEVQAAILLMLTHLYEHRGDDLSGGDDVWKAIDRLVVTYHDPALA